ncbi:MAG: alpha/beta fold hydrolase [Bryobacterales bacterium]|nr:alpha/beta fold hydrolase [Bryobacterales bacterium]
MHLRIWFLLVTMSMNLWAQAPDPVGIWSGVLDANGNRLTLVLHISRADDGTLSAKLDSPDQGAVGLPVSGLKVSADGAIAWDFLPGRGRFEGILKKTEMSGKWRQGALTAPLTLKRTERAPEPPVSVALIEEGAPSPLGIWEGTLNAGTANLRLILRVMRGAEGDLRAVLDSPDQGARDLPVSDLRVTREGRISWEFKPGRGRFEGAINAREMTGTWTQGRLSAPLTLKKTEKASARPRPQGPQPPFPYFEEDVVFEGGDDGVRLAGTLTKPKREGPFAAAILISGSGPQDRDETVFGHKPFLVVADYLTRRGIAVLRYDDRGVGRSSGNFGAATTADFAKDAEAAWRHLMTRKDIDARGVGLIGHSEGAIVATIVAAGNHSVKFVVMLAGLGIPAQEVLEAQGLDAGRAMGISEELLAKVRPYNAEVYAVMKSDLPAAEAQARIDAVLARLESDLAPDEKARIGPFFNSSAAMLSPWIRSFVRYDPAAHLRRVRAPVLALAGGKDIQVKAEPNIASIRAALEQGGNRDITAEILPGLNHLFQTAETGNIDEYPRLQETFAPSALKRIGDWICERTGCKAGQQG